MHVRVCMCVFGHTARMSDDRIQKKLNGCHRLGLHAEPNLDGETR